jgi:hypothetical protein
MKKVIFIFACLSLGLTALAQDVQQFKMRVTVSLRTRGGTDTKPVKGSCNSHFKITFQTRNIHTGRIKAWHWREGLSFDAGVWTDFIKTFYISEDEPVVAVRFSSVRYFDPWGFDDCDHGGANTTDFLEVPASEYPCGTRQWDGVFAGGYHANSFAKIEIEPLTDVYAIRTDITTVANNHIESLGYKVSLEYENGQTNLILDDHSKEDVPVGDTYYSRQLFSKSERRLVRNIHVSADINGGSEKTFPVDDPGTGAALYVTLNNPFGLGSGSELTIRYGLVKTLLQEPEGPAEGILPSTEDITLTIPGNSNDYIWWVSTNGGDTFRRLRSEFGTSKNLIISGEKFYGANWKNHFFENIFIKASYACLDDSFTSTVKLRHTPLAPTILAVVPVMETCHGADDAKLKITFDRSLYTGERVTVFLDNQSAARYPTSLNSENSLTITNLEPKTYAISFITKIGDNASYSEGAGHTASETISARPRITLTTTKQDVHCHDGEDGQITVTANGGTNNFDGRLYKNNGLFPIRFFSFTAGPHTISGLQEGFYTVRVGDSNGCEPKNNRNETIVPDETINHPSQVSLRLVQSVEPLGFGRTDGHITVRSSGGTMEHTFLWRDMENSTTLQADPTQREGQSRTSRLSGIGKGRYRVQTRSANYALASPQTEENRRGCYETLILILDEPPLLEVALAEYRHISCYGQNDGEIVAHANGGRPHRRGETDHPYRYEWLKMTGSSPASFGESDSIARERDAAAYRVKVTDRNGIEALSPVFQLAQPDALVLNFNTSELLCNGDKNGTSTVIATGGTIPYRYAWSTDETSSSIGNLTDGSYSVIVSDDRECTTVGLTEVKVPNGLRAEVTLINPTCYQYEDGTIRLSTSGGKPSYRYQWSTGAHTDFISNLKEGEYRVTIYDANNCFIEQEYSVKHPPLLPVDLGSDKVLCNDQSLSINATLGDPGARYQWSKNGVPYAATPVAVLTDPDTYSLRVTDSNGCVNEDAINITRDDVAIDANFTVATRIPKGESVRITNISNPPADQVEWIIPDGITVQEKTPAYMDLIFNSYGTYTLGLRSMIGACEKTEYQTIRSVEKSELTDYETPDVPYIKQFMVTPNENNGKFTVTVELKEKADFRLVFYSGQGNMIQQKEIHNQSLSTVAFDVSASVSSGVYLLQLITAHGVATFKVKIE